MEFRKKKDSFFMTGTTAKGNSMSYVEVADDKIVVYDQSKELLGAYDVEFSGKSKIDCIKPTEIVIYCNFEFTSAMLDWIEKSKIVRVLGTSNDRQQLKIHVLYGFDFEKWKEVVYDLLERFEL